MNLLGQLLLRVHSEETVGGQDKQIIILLNLMMKAFWIGNNELLEWLIADSPADCDRAVNPSDATTACYEAILPDDPLHLVFPPRVLVHRDLGHRAVLLEKIGARVANIPNRYAGFLYHSHEQRGPVLEPILAGNLKKVLVQVCAHYGKNNKCYREFYEQYLSYTFSRIKY